ncbi:hypothetical protein BBF96_13820 [Anoxybacter fermentans]|uniref:Uncharacterized protein n=2 Tax=Anoxybacter fermentans TaxID=1323375 RepID=A0A3Q9HS57_9FIRM|nr:hypothetical protein BBF96_13820 [Anoxybacter fermentans]
MLIEKHSEKDNFDDGDILLSILKDADNIGAMSILMYASKYDYNNSDYFSNVLKGLVEGDIPFCKKQKGLIRTEKGREIMDQKINFIRSFIQQLEDEIKGSLLQLEELIR